MSHDVKNSLKVDLLALFGSETDSTPTSIMRTPLKPGDTDPVRLHLDDGEIEEIVSADPGDHSNVIKSILSRRTKEFERLCDHFIDSDARYTLDDGSLEIEECEMEANDCGWAHSVFTQSFYAGCRDQNSSGNPINETLDLSLDRDNWVLTVYTTVPCEREPDEF